VSGRVRIGVLVSGGGSNFQALAEAVRDGRIFPAEISLVISNKPGAGALERAQRLGIASRVLEPKNFPDRTAFYDAMAQALKDRGVSLVCLAGFLLKLEPNFLRAFPQRILNIHPALLPKYGGPGMFGRHVHEAVLKAGEKETGCTVHWVDEEYDHGPALMQARVPVLPGDTPDALAARVLEQEHKLYPQAVQRVVSEIAKAAP
jgi:phosphoribosylglycinamide formyltransferase 1